MLRIASYDVVFQEVPGEVTLALNVSGCPNRCPGCHSPHLWESIGRPLDEALLERLLEEYGAAVTCVAVMGGDADPAAVDRLLVVAQGWGLKTAWYSGRTKMAPGVALANLDYLKLGPYVEALGPLGSPTTNQRFYRVQGGRLVDATVEFRKG